MKSTIKKLFPLLLLGFFTTAGGDDCGGGCFGSTEPCPNKAPKATIYGPGDGTSYMSGAAVTFTGSGNDPEDGVLTGASLVWTSTLDGQIGTGTSITKSDLLVGTHKIKLTVKDSKGASDSAVRTITVTSRPGQPTAAIQLPADSSSHLQGQPVSFQGTGIDLEDGTLTGASLVWTSSVDGQIGTGNAFNLSTLSLGAHTIELRVTDSQGLGHSVTRTITIIDDPLPTAAIQLPADGSSHALGQSVSFQGTGSDLQDGPLTGASLVWTSDLDGQIGTGNAFSLTTLSEGTHRITLTATNSRGAQGTASISITIRNQPPTAQFVFSCPTLSCSFTDQSTDSDGTIASWSWDFGDGNSDATQNPNHTYGASGTYTVTLTVTDDKGAAGTTAKSVTTGNQSPTATISAPGDGTSFPAGAAVTFTGSGDDPEDGALTGASLVWTSDVDGQIGTGTSVTTSTLSVGPHQIMLTATDGAGAPGTASITITITNQPPTAAIQLPADGSSHLQSQPVSFQGTGSDPEDGPLTGASLVWTSSADGQIGTGNAFSLSTLSLGVHTITLTATDSQGLSHSVTRTITIMTNSVPAAAIQLPADGSSHLQGQPVSFQGTGSDQEDGPLTGASLVWTSSVDGQIGTGNAFSLSTLSPGAHTITLKVTDSQGATDATSITITIRTNQPPTAAIQLPADGSSHLQGQPVSFQGTGNDPEDGALTGASLVWTSSVDGQIGTGNAFSLSTLSLGAHTITLTVTDSQGATDATSITITITTVGTSRIAFLSDRASAGNYGIYTALPDGSDIRPIRGATSYDFLYPELSPDGMWIAYWRDYSATSSGLFAVSTTDLSENLIYTLPLQHGIPRGIAWSPDGLQLAWLTSRTIYVVNSDGTNPRVLITVSAIRPYRLISWSPDGNLIAFSGEQPTPQPQFNPDRILLVDVNTGQVVWENGNLILTVHVGEPEFSHDGNRLAFTANLTGDDTDVFIWQIDTDVIYWGPLLPDGSPLPGDQSAPVWAPDDGALLFQSNHEGNFELYLWDGSTVTNVTQNPASDRHPSWSWSGGSAPVVSSVAPTRSLLRSAKPVGRLGAREP